MPKTYPAIQSKAVLILTIIVNVGLFAMLVSFLYQFQVTTADRKTQLFIGSLWLLILVPILLSWCLAPKSYRIEKGRLLVQPQFGPAFRLPLGPGLRIGECSQVDNLKRSFGNGGLFGVYGFFKDEDGRKYRLFLRTNQGPYIRIDTATRSYVLATDEHDALLAELKAACGS